MKTGMPPLDALLCPHCGKPLSPDGSPAAADIREILAGIQRIESTMSKTSDAIATIVATETEEAAELKTLVSLGQQAVTALNNQSTVVTNAVNAALAAANLDDATNAAALAAANTSMQADLASATSIASALSSALPPAPASA